MGPITSRSLDWRLAQFHPSGPQRSAAGLVPFGSDFGTDIKDTPVLPEDIVIGDVESAPRDRADYGEAVNLPQSIRRANKETDTPEISEPKEDISLSAPPDTPGLSPVHEPDAHRVRSDSVDYIGSGIPKSPAPDIACAKFTDAV